VPYPYPSPGPTTPAPSDEQFDSMEYYVMCQAEIDWDTWSRPYGTVAVTMAGTIECRDNCLAGGYTYFALECPMDDEVYCQCGTGLGSYAEVGHEYCIGDGTWTDGDHGDCTGSYLTDGIAFGDNDVAAVYRTHIGPSAKPTPRPTPRPTWSPFYLYSSSTMDWDACTSACEADGNQMACITSDSDNTEVYDLISSTAWIAFTDADSEGNWEWEGSCDSSYTNWNPGEPNDDGGEDCASMWTEDMQTGASAVWNDASCSSSYYCVCSS
jgi:hypothetical protein